MLAEQLSLQGLEIAPAQAWGAIRLVPLLRRQVREDLRLGLRYYDEDVAIVGLEGRNPLDSPELAYISYIPHALVANWTVDGSAAAITGCQMQAQEGRVANWQTAKLRRLHRMIRREDRNQVRFLPLHTAMESFLSLYFGGPNMKWPEYAHNAFAYGLSPRVEFAVPGHAINALQDALRLFERHPQQTGVLVFVSDALASAFVVSHPDDYAVLHNTLLEDFYGELIYQYALLYPDSTPMAARIDETQVHNLADLRRAYEVMYAEWGAFHEFAAGGLLAQEIFFQKAYRLGSFQLQRFITALNPREENHIGERIVRADGTLEYLKTYRLSAAQCRRAYLLQQLSLNDWNLHDTAKTLNITYEDLLVRIVKAGFGYLLKPQFQAVYQQS